MVKREQITDKIYSIIGDELLEKAKLKDEMSNGVQIEGKDKVKNIAIGVSLNEEFLKEAVNWGADICIFHHGIDPRTFKSLYPTYLQKRLRLVFENNLTIIGLHYVLDAHREIGNNAVIINKLGALIVEPYADDWGWMAEFEKACDLHELGHQCQEIFDHEVFVAAGGPEKVKRVVVVSGAYLPKTEDIYQMEQDQVQLLITGETGEWIPHRMLESGINYFVCGHYATEVFGVKALGDKLKEYYKDEIELKFIDIKNEI